MCMQVLVCFCLIIDYVRHLVRSNSTRRNPDKLYISNDICGRAEQLSSTNSSFPPFLPRKPKYNGVPDNYVVKFCYIYQKFATSSKIGRSLLMSDHFVFMGIEGVLNKILHACHCNIHIMLKKCN